MRIPATLDDETRTDTARRRTRAAVLGAALLASLTATSCGTLLHPERRGQSPGRIDPAIAVLDGIGLLVWVIPGLIAFAIDFSTGAIYMPAGGDDDLAVMPLAPGADRAEIAAAVRAATGHDVDLDGDSVAVVRARPGETVEEVIARAIDTATATTGG